MEVLNTINEWLWTYVVVTMLVLCAMYFTVRTRFVQFRLFRDMVKVIFEKPNTKSTSNTENNKSDISSFKAFSVALSSRVGTGNLAGVASAIFVGGPGAVFWMWVMALLGSATAFVEATLAQLYKKRGADSFYGGPAYYMEAGLGQRWMGVLFAILITITFGIANQMVQSTTLCDAISDTFAWNKAVVGAVVTLATVIIIFGGIQRISRFAAVVVPFMAMAFIVLALYVVIANIGKLPSVFALIIDSAFGVRSAAGGMVGVAVLQGVKRGLFSNEAGEGSAPNAAAIATTSHPIKQGLLQAFGVFVDTLIVCTCTAFIILISGVYDCGKDGILLTSEAMNHEMGSLGRYFITAAIFLFAYSTIIANYFYGETNIRFVFKSRWAVFSFRIVTSIIIMVGALMTLQDAWAYVDICMGFMTITNLVAIFLLSPKVFAMLKHYEKQKKDMQDPVFHKDDLEENNGVECWN
ncbi:MAG: alanine:cation symporter family protein [Bacteroidaceae bacterium]|nr:alanine:cation symporter family protein [Bacteroidaceae bacterium]